VEQLIAGCVTAIGAQGANIARNAWLAEGLPYEVPATTIDFQCGSSQQASHLLAGMIAGGELDIGIAAGVEGMSTVPLGSNISSGPGSPRPTPFPWDVPADQFEAAERIAVNRSITRDDVDKFAVLSHSRALEAQTAGLFGREICEVEVAGGTTIAADEGPRASSVDKLATLSPIKPDGIHTAATSSQISDGAAAVLWASSTRASELGITPRGRMVAHAVVGSDPYYYLDGPIDATRAVLKRAGMSLSDIDIYEVNEAFAAVPLSWLRTLDGDPERLNVNGGAIALGHPVGATGARLITAALHELERSDRTFALISMCCGGALATATIIERV
jgi:acetyl-CoA C-acetyltransferase